MEATAEKEYLDLDHIRRTLSRRYRVRLDGVQFALRAYLTNHKLCWKQSGATIRKVACESDQTLKETIWQ